MASVAKRLKRQRELAGLSQSNLAAATGIAQPNISAYESGQITPRPETVDRLMAALRLRPSVAVERLRGAILEAASRHRVIAVEIFGSLATGHDTPDSDVDLLVHLEQGASLFDLALFANEVEEIIGFPVDAISANSTGSAMSRIRAEAVPL
jgi:predicted nucleotidyltransferase